MDVNHIRDVCRHLRAAAPQEWHEFVQMFTEYTGEAIDNVTEADAGTIMEAKGFAKSNKAWLNTFTHLDTPAPQRVQMPPTPIPP